MEFGLAQLLGRKDQVFPLSTKTLRSDQCSSWATQAVVKLGMLWWDWENSCPLFSRGHSWCFWHFGLFMMLLPEGLAVNFLIRLWGYCSTALVGVKLQPIQKCW